MSRQFYAYSLPDKPVGEWQKLEEHLKNTAELARKFAEPFGSGDWSWNAEWIYDRRLQGEL